MNENHIFFTADTHYGHSNIMRYCHRPFDTIEEHDAQLIKNTNDMVGENDVLYHLGDFAFAHAWAKRSKELATSTIAEYRSQIKCKNIILIMGNHDPHYANGDPRKELTDLFEVHKMLRIKIDHQKIILLHYALKVWDCMHYGAFSLFAHSHNSLFCDLEDDIDSAREILGESVDIDKLTAFMSFMRRRYGADSKSIDVGVDAVASRLAGQTYSKLKKLGFPRELLKPENYRPMSYAEVAAIMATKEFTPVDHHEGRTSRKSEED